MGQGTSRALGASRKSREGGDDQVKRQIDSDVSNRKPIYELVNVKTGGGKLIELIKSHVRCSRGSFGLNKSFGALISSASLSSSSASHEEAEAALDDQIRKLVEPLLYNEGRGKLVALDQLWSLRLGPSQSEQANLTQPDADGLAEGKWAPKTKAGGHRWTCWRLEERGFVGETALHICFLLSTPTHMILAQRLLKVFPMLINDIYTCDEYFGESSLHMAIVNEDVKIVKLLLDHGANVHQRCLGSFFLPNDQKNRANGTVHRLLSNVGAVRNDGRRGRRRGSLQQVAQLQAELDQLDLESNHFSSLETNYDGYCYWGEFPLSFAASLGLVDCYKLLLAKGADPNRKDSNGNATLHLAVIANRLDMFDLCYSNGANLNALNKLNLSPLTLAAKLCRVEMFFHILTIRRQVSWSVCQVGFLETPLEGIDSISSRDGSCDHDSLLAIVVAGNSNEHLQMLDGLLSELLQVKWTTSARAKFRAWLYTFLLFLAISSVAYITRFGRRQQNWGQHYLWINSVSECLLVGYVVYYLWIITTRIASRSRRGHRENNDGPLETLVQAPEVAIFSFTCLLILFCIPLRICHLTETEDFLAAIVMFLLPLKLLFFCRASKSLGSFIVMIYKILVNDVLCFVVFLVIFVAGFSQSFAIIFKTHRGQTTTERDQGDRNYFANLFDGIISMHMMALNEFTLVFDEFNSTSYPTLSKVLFCFYMVLVSILLINMLIAMLGKTYQDIQSQPNESLRQWARALLTVERMWSNADRLKMLDRYSHEGCLPDGQPGERCRYYSSTWALTQRDLDEMESVRRLTCENKLNSARLKRRKLLASFEVHEGPKEAREQLV